MRLPPISTSPYRADSCWPWSSGQSSSCSSASSTSAFSSSGVRIGVPLRAVDRVDQLLRRGVELRQQVDGLLERLAALELQPQLLEPVDLRVELLTRASFAIVPRIPFTSRPASSDA